ncbi:hypothetical protein [Allosphingosinicella sp.]|jgi:hypothetical protein|uniref:hypothetical protein n=1 Tax=Allosphingosinicella sp. TaxID=2823234 RepID=UPI002F090F7B
MIEKFAAALLLLAAQPGTSPECMPRESTGQMVVVLLPSVIDVVTERCTPHARAGSFLGERSRAMAQRLRTETAAVRSAAVSGILRLSGQPAVPGEGQDPEVMINLVTASMMPEMDAQMCRSAGDVLEALSPLPASNLALMSAAIVAAYAARAGEDDAPAVCAA